MGCCTCTSKPLHPPSRLPFSDHLLGRYAILQLAEPIGELRASLAEPLIKVRNPHGHGEYNGRYSDNDTELMTEELRSGLNHTMADDGTFWMALSDFQAIFSRMDLCLSFATTDIKALG